MTDSFTDQKPRIVTSEDLNTDWDGTRSHSHFRCYLCGHKFELGDIWRWVYGFNLMNFLVCEECDGPDVLDRWIKVNEELHTRFWWAIVE